MCEYFKFGRSRGSRAVFFAISRSLKLLSCSFSRLAVVLGSEGRARATPALAPPRRWLQRARKVVKSYLRDLRTSTQSHIKSNIPRHLANQRPVYFFATVPAVEQTLNIL